MVLGLAGGKKDDDDKDTPVRRANLEQLKEMLRNEKDVVPKKAKPKGTGAGTLLQKLAAKALALSKGPSRAEHLLPVAQAKRDRYKEGGILPKAEARASRREGGRQMAKDGQAVLSCSAFSG